MRKFLITSTILLSSVSTAALAHEASKGQNPDVTEINFSEVVVTANPLGRVEGEIVKPFKALNNHELNRKKSVTLGETLNRELGVNSTFFAPGASRPVIRGLGNENIAVLQNGLNNIDASSVSPDHAIAIDPFNIERVEILRGAQALFYGARAIGGVINVIDNRIPSENIEAPITGFFETKYNTADNSRSAGVKAEGGIDGWNYNVSGFSRDTDNYDIPGFARSSNARNSDPLPVIEEVEGRQTNAQTRNRGGNIGFSKVFEDGYIGIAFSALNSEYGIPSEADEEVAIGMHSRRFDLAGAFDNVDEYIKRIKYSVGIVDYNHSEYEAGVPEKTFKNNGYDARVELTHFEKFGFEGAFGLQSQVINASAVGAESLYPITDTFIDSLFIYEERSLKDIGSDVVLEFGARTDMQRIDKTASATFGAASERDDDTYSGSFGFHYDFGGEEKNDYVLASHLTYTERAPNAQELFSNGEHHGTGTFEVGNQNLKVQRSTGIDLGITKQAGDITGSINAFYNKFSNFISLNPTGGIDGGSGLPIFLFAGVPAEFYGAEASAKTNIYKSEKGILDAEIRFDYVQAENTLTNQPLPRISPMRLGGNLNYNMNNKVNLNLDAHYVFRQDDVAQNETETGSYVMLDFGVDYILNANSERPTSIFAQATNLLDDEARNHVSFTKDLVVMPGRSIMIGLRQAF